MTIEETIGKTITNIYCLVTSEQGGLDKGECFIELDHKFIIDIPYGLSDNIWLKELSKDAVSVFVNLANYPIYHVNKQNKTIAEIAHNYQQQKQSAFNRLHEFLFGYNPVVKDYIPHKVEQRENKLKHIKDKKVVDYIWYDNNTKGFFLLDNGYLITETTTAPNGTGLTGLNYFESLEDIIKVNGNNYLKLTDKTTDN